MQIVSAEAATTRYYHICAYSMQGPIFPHIQLTYTGSEDNTN